MFLQMIDCTLSECVAYQPGLLHFLSQVSCGRLSQDILYEFTPALFTIHLKPYYSSALQLNL